MIRFLTALLLLAVFQAPSASAFERFGIVLLHGKTGMPGQFTQLARDLTDLGYLIETPEMCWSARRIYDRSFTGCFDDIDAAIARCEPTARKESSLPVTASAASAHLPMARPMTASPASSRSRRPATRSPSARSR